MPNTVPPVDVSPDSGAGEPEPPREISYPKRFPIANSDNASQSPWSKRLVLSLDGGGVRGYSSLLVLRRLMCIIADLESGKRNDLLDEDERRTWVTYNSSAEYPWRNPPHDSRSDDREQAQQPPQDRSTVNASPRNSVYQSAVSWQGTQNRTTVAAQGNALQPTQTSAGDSSSSNTAQSKRSGPERDSWKDNELLRFRVHHYFDYVAGTSTGGLSALMLSRMGMDIDDALRQYSTVGNKVFAHPRPHGTRLGGILRPRYASSNMNEAIREVVAHGSKKEIARTKPDFNEIRLTNENEFACRTAVIAYGGPNKNMQTCIFRSYNRTHSKDKSWFNIGSASSARVWKVARATSAAPLYFSKQTIEKSTYIDGGMGCNNPAELISQEVKGAHGRNPDLILSIGTGTKADAGEPHQTRKHKLLDNARNVIRALRRLPDIATESEKCHVSLEQAMDSLRATGSSKYPMYYRFNVPDLGTVELDAWVSTAGSKTPDGMQTLQKLENDTLAYLNNDETAKRNLEACAKELVRMRRERATTERWEQFATHTTYRCPENDDHECKSLVFSSRAKLRLHASERHEYVPWVLIGDNPVCIIDECAEKPRLFEGKDAEDQLLRHLKEPPHNIKHAKPIATSGLEAWMDRERTTRDAAFQEQLPSPAHEQNGYVQQPQPADPHGSGSLSVR